MTGPTHPSSVAGVAQECAAAAIVIRAGQPDNAPLIAGLIARENDRPAHAAEIEGLLGTTPSGVAVCVGELVGMIIFATDGSAVMAKHF